MKYIVWSIQNTGRFFSHRKCHMLPNINRYLRTNSEWCHITSLPERCLVSTEAETAHWFLDEREGSFLFQRIERHNATCRHDTIKFPNRRSRYWEHSKANVCGFHEVIHSIRGLLCNKNSAANSQHVFMIPRQLNIPRTKTSQIAYHIMDRVAIMSCYICRNVSNI